ncbi:MAG TPA: hypothetical protein VFD49_09115 [Candidatus Dormibacteraeota bacterium]|nr:hypothetical protein [Candidatus Dormibacteraeota bacterium]
MSIYTSPPADTTVYAVGSDPLTKQLGWTASQVLVDNPTNQWLYLPQARRWVAPGVMGAVVPLPGNTSVQVAWLTPPGYTAAPIVAGQEATLVWLSPEIEAVPSPGVATTPLVTVQQGTVDITGPVTIGGNVPVVNAAGNQLAVLRQQSQLSGSPFTAKSGTTTSQSFNLSGSTHAVGILIGNPGGCSSIQVVGNVSGAKYLSEVPSSAGGLFFAPVLAAVDTSVTVSCTTYQGQTSQVWVVEVDDPQALAVISNSGFYNTVGYDPFGNLLGVGSYTQQPGYSSLAVTHQWSNPAPWQAPSDSIAVHQAFNANTDYTLINGVAGKQIYLHEVNLVWDATSQWELALYDGPSSGGVVVGELSLFTQSPPPISFRGRPLTAGNALVARSTGNVTGRGTVTYSQA